MVDLISISAVVGAMIGTCALGLSVYNTWQNRVRTWVQVRDREVEGCQWAELRSWDLSDGTPPFYVEHHVELAVS